MGVDSPIDVSPEQYETILTLLRKYLPETTAWVYGSRVKWTSRPHSDLDLVVFAEPGQHLEVGELREAFEESNLPFRVDLFVWDDVPNSFRENIREQHIELMLGCEKASEPVISHPESDEEAGLLFGNCASLLSKSVDPASLSQSIPYIGLEHIAQEKLHLNGTGELTDVTSTKRRFVRGNILFGKLRPYFRKVVQPDFDGICSTDIWVIEPKENVDSRFLFYWCASWDFVDFLDASSEGTRMPRAKWEVAINHRIPAFSAYEQKAIGYILGTLDDKIELNQKINQTLEETAKAIFKSWFVDFDPVRAKAEGRPTGLPPEISDMFPDKFEDSEIGEIPMGWNLLSIDDVCMSIYSGGTPSTKTPEFWTGENPWLSSGETRNKFILQTEKQISKTAVDKSSTRHAQKFDTVIASAGQGKTRGQTSMLLLDAFVNQSVVVLRADTDKVSKAHLFFNLERRYEEFRRHSDSSSSRGSLTTTLLKKLPYIFPGVKLTHRFSKVVWPMIDSIENRLTENVLLVELRDTLLPKLISGELRIPDAEKFLEEADI